MATQTVSKKLSDLLATKDLEIRYTDAQGKNSNPVDADVISFDWSGPSRRNYGTVVIVLEESDLLMFFGDNLGRSMEDPQDKSAWLGSEDQQGFVQQIKNFATRNNIGTFTLMDINQLKHHMAGMAAIKEGLFEGYYGNRKVSYMGEATAARLVIKHNRVLGEMDKRYRYVESLFIETADGERFKLPFVKLAGGRAMLEHVRQGGRPYDIRGSHITETVTEMNVLSRFRRASQNRMFEGTTANLVESAGQYSEQLKNRLTALSSTKGYQQYFESWTPADIGSETQLVEDIKQMFIEQTLDSRIESALPVLAKIQQQGTAMKEAEIFETWANKLVEGTWALPDNAEAQAKLNDLMSKELIVGPDATNATEQLYDVVGDDQLFDVLQDLARRDPRANIWDDTDVQARLAELGIQTPQSTQAEPADVAQDTAPKQQGVAEGLVGDVVVHNYTKIPIDLEPGQAQIAGWGPNDEPLYRVKGQDGKEVKTWSKRRMLTIAKEQGVAEATGDKKFNSMMSNITKKKMAVDRKTGKEYDPEEEMSKLLDKHKSQFQGMAAIEKAQKKGVAEAAKWRQGYRASGHPPGYQHKSGEIGPLGGTYDTTSNYGDEVKVPVNRYRDEPDRLADREKTKLSTSGKPLTAKNAARNLKTAIGQAKGKHGPVGVLPEQSVAEGDDNFGKPAAMMRPSAAAAKTAQNIVQKQADQNVIGMAKIAGTVPAQGVAEGSADKTVKVVKRRGKPIGEIGIDPEASPGNGSYYVKLYDGSVDLSGFDTAEEALAELKYLVKQSVAEGSCNQTMEGEYCPEHGLSECAMEEGWKGELAGGTLGSIAGTMAGQSVLGPLGALVGGGLVGTAGGMIGRKLGDLGDDEPKKLAEIAPLVGVGAAAARALIPALSKVGPKLAQMFSRAGQAAAPAVKKGAEVAAAGAGQAAKQGAEIAAKNAIPIGIGAGAYSAITDIAQGLVGGVGEVYKDVAGAASAIGQAVGDAVDENTILQLASLAVKYALPVGIVLALLYGGKKVMDKVMAESTDDPMNYNAAITGSYYESDELARIKTLALLK